MNNSFFCWKSYINVREVETKQRYRSRKKTVPLGLPVLSICCLLTKLPRDHNQPHSPILQVYREDSRSIFPPELARLSSQVASVVGYPGYKAEAAIVNFYPLSASLSGHTDHSENNLAAPLISISIGQSAIFLLGGSTVQQAPAAFMVRSGDILVMEKEARLAYHAVPKIVSGPDILGGKEGFCSNYLALHRININIRQVH